MHFTLPEIKQRRRKNQYFEGKNNTAYEFVHKIFLKTKQYLKYANDKI